VKRILVLVPNLEYGGGTKQLELLATGLLRDRFALQVAVLGAAGPVADVLLAAGVPVEVLGWGRLFDVNPFRRLRQLIDAQRPDVVHAWGMSSLRGLVVTPGREKTRIYFNSFGEDPPSGPIRTQFDLWLLSRAHCLVATNLAEAKLYRDLGQSDEKIVVIPPGVALAQGASLVPQPSLALKDRVRLLVCIGPLEPHKGFQDAIWAFDILKYLDENLQLILAGDGSDRGRLEQFVHAIQATASIHFLGRLDNVGTLLARAEVVWVPSRAKGGINVALEAMAAGRPVVASRVPGLAEVVGDGETGFLVPPEDKVALARQTRLLLEDAALRRRLGEAGRQRAASQFAAADMVRRYAELYEK
jgi:glycosyltransferase involved in cell wall biosynthesis